VCGLILVVGLMMKTKII